MRQAMTTTGAGLGAKLCLEEGIELVGSARIRLGEVAEL